MHVHAFFRGSLLDSIPLNRAVCGHGLSLTLYSGIVPANFGGPMFLKAEQLWMVATVYDKVAADTIGVPSPQRAAFARKAKRLRMLARIAAKIEATAFVKLAQPPKSRQEGVSGTWCASSFGERPKVKYKTLAERLETARAAASGRKQKLESDEPSVTARGSMRP